MTKDNMSVISITPGATVKVEHFKFGTVGSLEYNVQQEFDYRREAMHTPQVVNKPISSDADWGLTGWTPGDSLEVTTSAGDLLCDQGIADVGGRRYIRTGSGSIKAEVGDPADATYFIRIKYVVSTDTHSFIAEAAESVETNDNKYLTLAQATWTDPNWTAEVDLRSSNTSLNPPVTFSGDTDASVAPVLTITQTGSTEQSLEVYGGDIQFFTSGSPFKQVIYGNSTDAIEIHNAAVASGKLRAGTVADTLYVDNFDIATQLDVASLTFSTTIIANATEIGDLATITLAATGASFSLTDGSDQIVGFSNAGAGNINITVDGKVTVSATGTSIAGSATVGGVVLNDTDVTADKITLSDTTNQVYINSAGASDGIITTASLSGGDKTYTLPNTTGTFAVTGTGGMSVDSSGQVVHSNASGYKHVPGGGATTAVLMGDGSDGSVWDSTPSFSTLTATSSGSSIASSASVGGVTLNIGAISGVTTLSASNTISTTGSFLGDYITLTDDAGTPSTNQLRLGNAGGGGTTLQIVTESDESVTILPTSGYASFSCSGTSGFTFTSNITTGNHLIVGTSKTIYPNTAGAGECGTDTKWWDKVHADNYYYKVGPNLISFDHLDDIAIIESISPRKGKGANLSGLPKEIMDKKKGFVDSGNMSMLLAGAIKQMSGRLKEMEKLVGVLMDRVEELGDAR